MPVLDFFTILVYNGNAPTEMADTTYIHKVSNYEWMSPSGMYPTMAREAEEEGFTVIAELFRKVADIEREHEMRFRALLENIKNDEVFKRSEENEWECKNCGHIYKGNEAPEVCPVCAHPQSYFEIRKKNY